MLPFTREEFLGVFARYHEAMGFAVWLFYAGAAAALIAIFFTSRRTAFRCATGYLSVAWIWMGTVYHWGYFRQINPAAGLFAALFVVQGLLLIRQTISPTALRFERPSKSQRIVAAVLMIYSLIIYPLLGLKAGHGYPNGPSFGLPCPTTIFTFSILLLVVSERRLFLRLAAIPGLWSIIGTFAAIKLSILEDWALLPSAILAVGTKIWDRRTG